EAEVRHMIHFACPHCKIKLKTDNEKIGRLARCPRCKGPLEVPKSLGELAPLDFPEESANYLPALATNALLPVPVSDIFDAECEGVQKQKKIGFLALSMGVTSLAFAGL